jgi:hypothetical protein
MQAFRADATAQVSATVGGGGVAPVDFPVDSESYPLFSLIQGTVLAVVYSNPGEEKRCIAFFDGGVDTTGDVFSLALDQPLDPGLPGFEVLMSVGIAYSTATNPQRTIIDVNGRRLTSVAGGTDDSPDLLTVGGQGDDPANPDDPFAAPFMATDLDDELYDLAQGDGTNPTPFVSAGETLITVETENLSDDDNLFFAGFNVVVPEAECFLVIGDGPGAATYLDVGHLFHTQVDGVEDAHEVLMDDIPEFVLPVALGRRAATTSPGQLSAGSLEAGPLGDGPAGTTPEWMLDGDFALQVLMWNPEVFPGQPEQYTAGLYVSIQPDGSVVTTPFGTDLGGMQVWHEIDVNAAGQRVIRFPFLIPGFEP